MFVFLAKTHKVFFSKKKKKPHKVYQCFWTYRLLPYIQKRKSQMKV